MDTPSSTLLPDSVSLTGSLLDSVLTIFKYLFSQYGIASPEVDRLMDIYRCIFSEELSSQIQQKLKLAALEHLFPL